MGHRGYSGNHPRFSRRGDERYDAKEAYNKDLTASARLHYLENDRHDHTSPNHMSVNQRLDDSFGMGQNTDQAPSPMNKHTRAHRLREKAINISEKSGAERGDEYDYENPRVQRLLDRANAADERSMNSNIESFIVPKQPGHSITKNLTKKPKVGDERSSEIRNEMINEMIDERPDSPLNQGHDEGRDYFRENDSILTNKWYFQNKNLLNKQLAKGDERSEQTKIKIQNLMNDPDQSRYINEEAQNDLQVKQDQYEKEGEQILAAANKKSSKKPKPNEVDHVGSNLAMNRIKSPLEACAKSEGGSGCVQERGGEWKVISNKTGKPWPGNYGSKSNAEAALRGYHAG